MPAPALITQADLQERYPPQHVRGVFGDDGSTTPGPRLAVACVVATRQAEAILRKAWSTDAQIAGLVAEDEAIKSALCDLAMAEGVKGKPEWSGEGAPYATLRKDALAMLEMLAKAELRTRAEGVAAVGPNPNRKGNIASPDSPAFLFAPNRARPRPGGY